VTVPGRTNHLDVTPTRIALELMVLARDLADATSNLEDLEKAVSRRRKTSTSRTRKPC
jgi:hypothetical protein